MIKSDIIYTYITLYSTTFFINVHGTLANIDHKESINKFQRIQSHRVNSWTIVELT